MKFTFLLLLVSFASCLPAQPPPEPMTNEKMKNILTEVTQNLEGQMGNWQFMVGEIPCMIITDTNANRMRIMSPIVEEKELQNSQYQIMLEANFDRALDAKYATYKGVVWSVFTHPLGELTTDQFMDAIAQVVTLSESFGTTYASTDMIFGGGE